MLIKNTFFLGIIVIPLSNQGNWKLDTYSKIPPNVVSFSKSGISIKIHNSASPLIYSFDHPKIINKISISGEFKGLPKFLDYSLQGQKGFDDYPLRIGLILVGNSKLSTFQKYISPEWIKKLYDDIPNDQGISYVQFYNVTQNPAQVGTNRVHPTSDLLHENFFAYIKESGKFSYDIKIDTPKKISGIWINSDGDDTHSEYEVDIFNLQIETE